MKNRNTVYLLGALIVALGAIALYSLFNSDSTGSTETDVPQGIEGNPTDITLDFYNDWIDLREATSSNLLANELIDSDIISSTLRTRLTDALNDFAETGFDPVLCSTVIPDNKRSKTVFESETDAQVVVFDKDAEVTVQRSFTLKGSNGVWQITNIQCSAGEQALNLGEYSFETEGRLLRDSLPETFDKQYWYIVYENNDQAGFTAPLLFTPTSTCVDTEDNELSCGETFFEAQRVYVQGNMTEGGPEVVRLEVID